jgi:hypothetical protein
MHTSSLGDPSPGLMLVGDFLADIMAGHLAGVAVIGSANKRGKAEPLADA